VNCAEAASPALTHRAVSHRLVQPAVINPFGKRELRDRVKWALHNQRDDGMKSSLQLALGVGPILPSSPSRPPGLASPESSDPRPRTHNDRLGFPADRWSGSFPRNASPALSARISRCLDLRNSSMEPDSFVRARPCAPKLMRWAAGERLRSRLDFALLPWHALRYQVRPELELLRFCLTSIRTGRVSRPGIILLASLSAVSWKQAARQQETKMRESPSICTRLRLEACQRAMPCFREGGFEPGMVGGQALSWPKPRRRIAGCWSGCMEPRSGLHLQTTKKRNNWRRAIGSADKPANHHGPQHQRGSREVTMTRRGSLESSGVLLKGESRGRCKES
jgi:hypothetical protein